MRTLGSDEIETMAADYQCDGFAYVRELFTSDDLAPLASALGADGSSQGGFAVTDSKGGQQELSVWTELGNDLVGVLPRLDRVVSLAVAAIGEPVCHWHSKLSWKRPGSNSLWDWHQDFGFWFTEGLDRPDMCTIAIAMGPVTEANGCMKLVRGSHTHGRIDVIEVGQSRASDPGVVDPMLETHDVELCELALGDAVIFHSNTLHGSGPNNSELPRTMLMSSYNAVSNPPSAPQAGGRSTKTIEPLPDSALTNGWTDIFGESLFINPVTSGLDQGYAITMLDAEDA